MKKVCLVITVALSAVILLNIAVLLFGRTFPLGKKVAIVRVAGTILSSSGTIEELIKYRKNSSVKAVVLRVNSPGGAVAPSQEIYEEIRKLGREKPVVASLGTVAASGGYYIASAAEKIYANPGTLTGSIGVIMEIPNLKGLMDKVGVKSEVIKSGRHKDMVSVFKGIDEEGRLILQGLLDDVHGQFIKAVSESRKMRFEDAKEIADGRVFTGRQAKDIGLIDELGNLQDAITEAARISGIEGEPKTVTREERFSFFNLLTSGIPDGFKELTGTIRLKYLMHY